MSGRRRLNTTPLVGEYIFNGLLIFNGVIAPFEPNHSSDVFYSICATIYIMHIRYIAFPLAHSPANKLSITSWEKCVAFFAALRIRRERNSVCLHAHSIDVATEREFHSMPCIFSLSRGALSDRERDTDIEQKRIWEQKLPRRDTERKKMQPSQCDAMLTFVFFSLTLLVLHPSMHLCVNLVNVHAQLCIPSVRLVYFICEHCVVLGLAHSCFHTDWFSVPWRALFSVNGIR